MDQRPTIPSSSSHPTLCRMGCGFFGNAATDGMCSKCYRDHERRKQQQQSQAGPSRLRAPATPRIPSEGERGEREREREWEGGKGRWEVHVCTNGEDYGQREERGRRGWRRGRREREEREKREGDWEWSDEYREGGYCTYIEY